VTDDLIKRGQVKQEQGVYYIPDMASFTKLIMEGPRWQGTCGLTKRQQVIPTDPTKSTSGSEFVALLAAMLLNGDVPTEKTIQPLLPALKEYIESLGTTEPTSSKLFPNCIRTGMGACPIFALYEAQGIDFIKANPAEQKAITDRLRFLYPKPTVWAAHELIALTPKGKMILDAMKDKQIQAGTVAVDRAVGLRLSFRMPPPIDCVSNQFLIYLNSTVATSAYRTWARLSPPPSALFPPERFHFEVLDVGRE
jgi:hypothetical protein